MKRFRKILTAVLTTVMAFSLSTVSVLATEESEQGSKQSYTYTITFYAGNQGEFAEAEAVPENTAERLSVEGLSVSNPEAVIVQSGDKIVVSGLHAGDEVGLTAQSAIDMDTTGKYYVKGIRLSGRDNNTVAASAFTVKGDADYVVAYGIKGNQVGYTVHYQDKQGNLLAPSETFYGNVGDKPVVAYKFIDGYAPQALGITKTLSANAAENIFTFVYENMPTPDIQQVVTEEVVTTVETIVVDGVTVVVPEGTNTDTETGDGTGTGESGTDVDGSETGNAEENDDSGSVNQGGEESEILDLDDEEVPLADQQTDGDSQTVLEDAQMAVYVGLAAAAAAVFLIIVFVLLAMKKRGKDAQEETQEEA